MEDDKAGIAWNGKLTGERGSVRLIRGWERQYAPEKTAGLRLNKASVYRAIREEEGVEDRREGEIRIRTEGEVKVEWEPNEVITATASRVISKREAPDFQRQMREALATQFDDPKLALQSPEF